MKLVYHEKRPSLNKQYRVSLNPVILSFLKEELVKGQSQILLPVTLNHRDRGINTEQLCLLKDNLLQLPKKLVDELTLLKPGNAYNILIYQEKFKPHMVITAC